MRKIFPVKSKLNALRATGLTATGKMVQNTALIILNYDNYDGWLDIDNYAREDTNRPELNTSPSFTPKLFYQMNPQNYEIADRYDRVYPHLNRTGITLRIDRREVPNEMKAILSHTMPYFDRFQVQIDETGWKEAGKSLPWNLHEGINIIEARAVNKAGIIGRPSRIVVRNNLDIALYMLPPINPIRIA